MIGLDLPEEESRLESGVVQVGQDDWPGIFIRGDEALYAAHLLRMFIKSGKDLDKISMMGIENLASLLESCKV